MKFHKIHNRSLNINDYTHSDLLSRNCVKSYYNEISYHTFILVQRVCMPIFQEWSMFIV